MKTFTKILSLLFISVMLFACEKEPAKTTQQPETKFELTSDSAVSVDATGGEVIAFAHKVVATVREKFGIEISPEVNVL